MDDLADAAAVSRRTLFNYFPSKLDAVLGEPPVLPAEALARFHAGGPTGDLVADLGELGKAILDEEDHDPELACLAREVFTAEPRVLGLAHERFRRPTEQLEAEVAVREGADHDPLRARVAVRLITVMFALTLERFIAEPEGRDPTDYYAEVAQATRALFR